MILYLQSIKARTIELIDCLVCLDAEFMNNKHGTHVFFSNQFFMLKRDTSIIHDDIDIILQTHEIATD